MNKKEKNELSDFIVGLIVLASFCILFFSIIFFIASTFIEIKNGGFSELFVGFKYFYEALKYIWKISCETPVIGIALTLLISSGFFGLVYLLLTIGDNEDNIEYESNDNDFIDDLKDKTNLLAKENVAIKNIKFKYNNFNEGNFKNRINRAFTNIKKVQTKENIDQKLNFISDGLYEEYFVKADYFNSLNIIDKLNSLTIKKINIVGYKSEYYIDNIFVRIEAVAKYVKYDQYKNKQLESIDFLNRKNIVEYWTLCRKKGVNIEEPEKGLIEGFCPNCGQDIKLTSTHHGYRINSCPSCQYPLRSGLEDWVLVDIADSPTKIKLKKEKLPGVTKYISYDYYFNPQHIEDLVRVFFWRKIYTERIGKYKDITNIFTNSFLKKLSSNYTKKLNYKNCDNCNIESINIAALDSTSNDSDFIYVKIKWNGIGSFNFVKHFNNIFILKRNRNIMTDEQLSLCHAPCPKCGFFEKAKDSNRCEICGEQLDNGCSDWVLVDILTGDSNKLNKVIDEINNNISKPILTNEQNNWRKNRKKQETRKTIYKELADSDLFKNQQDETFHRMGGSVFEDEYDGNNDDIVSINNGISTNKSQETIENISEDPKFTQNKIIQPKFEDSEENNISNEEKIKWLVAMMMSGNGDEASKKATVSMYATDINFDFKELEKNIKDMRKQEKPIEFLAQNADLPLNYDLMRNLIKVAFANGKVEPTELQIIKFVAKKMNMPEDNLKAILEYERKTYLFHQK